MTLESVSKFAGNIWQVGTLIAAVVVGSYYVTKAHLKIEAEHDNADLLEIRINERHNQGIEVIKELKRDIQAVKEENTKLRLEIQYIKGKEGY